MQGRAALTAENDFNWPKKRGCRFPTWPKQTSCGWGAQSSWWTAPRSRCQTPRRIRPIILSKACKSRAWFSRFPTGAACSAGRRVLYWMRRSGLTRARPELSMSCFANCGQNRRRRAAAFRRVLRNRRQLDADRLLSAIIVQLSSKGATSSSQTASCTAESLRPGVRPWMRSWIRSWIRSWTG